MKMNTSESIDKLAVALNKAMQQANYVQKEDGGYQGKYISEAALVDEVRPALVDNGLMVIPAVVKRMDYDSYNNAKGTMMHRVDIVMTYKLVHVSGQWLDMEIAGSDADSGSKATTKALTYAHKALLRQLFTIRSGDDKKPAELLQEFNTLGRKYYNGEWDKYRPKWCNHLSDGKYTSSTALDDEMLGKGIRILRQRLDDHGSHKNEDSSTKEAVEAGQEPLFDETENGAYAD